MSEPKDAMVAFKLTGRDRLAVDHAVKLEGITLSELARTAILPAAREIIVSHAIKARPPNAAA